MILQTTIALLLTAGVPLGLLFLAIKYSDWKNK
jgi:hypothetical protein